MFGHAYLDFQAACMSMKPLMADAPGLERLMHRAKSVCLHEIGHTLGLHDHYDEAGRRCVMHGTVSAEELLRNRRLFLHTPDGFRRVFRGTKERARRP